MYPLNNRRLALRQIQRRKFFSYYLFIVLSTSTDHLLKSYTLCIYISLSLFLYCNISSVLASNCIPHIS